MVLADAKRVQVELIGQDRLFDNVAEDAGLWLARAVSGKGDVSKRIEADFESICHPATSLLGCVRWPTSYDFRSLTPSGVVCTPS